jgi:hypothetical protein
MSAALLSPPSLDADEERARFQWTRAKFHQAREAGMFPPEERWELIEGQLYRKRSENPPHVTALFR